MTVAKSCSISSPIRIVSNRVQRKKKIIIVICAGVLVRSKAALCMGWFMETPHFWNDVPFYI